MVATVLIRYRPFHLALLVCVYCKHKHFYLRLGMQLVLGVIFFAVLPPPFNLRGFMLFIHELLFFTGIYTVPLLFWNFEGCISGKTHFSDLMAADL